MVYIYNAVSFRLKKDILTSATTWVNPGAMMLSEISWAPKDKCCMVPLIERTRRVRLIKKAEQCDQSPRGVGGREVVLHGDKASNLQEEKSSGD